jgi:uncharacterized membrane protein YdbT with pleckstrin-like domain
MTPGVRVAKEFGFEVPTKVRLDYDGAKNLFRLTRLGNIQVPNVLPARVKEEPIEIVSDNEMEEEEEEEEDEDEEEEEEEEDEEEEPENVHFYHFEKKVTEALASVTKPQVLVCELHNIFQLHVISLSSFVTNHRFVDMTWIMDYSFYEY